MADSYVCSGAMMKCTMGTTPARLTVLPIRTVFLTGQPMANISDHLTMVNLAPFGLCRSLGFPATASATAAALGTLTPMPCMHNTPFPWMGGKMDYLVQNQPALLKSCKCQCMWGGTISLVNDGQMGEGTQWVSKSQNDEFDKDLSNNKGIDVNSVLDGIQIALDIAGLVPGFGAIPDLTNAAISALRGDWVGAGVSMLAAVPGIGDAAAAAKFARKGLKVAATANKGGKATKAINTLSKEEKRTIAKKYISKDVTKEALLKEKGVTSKNVDEVYRQVKIERKREAINFYKENMYTVKENKKIVTNNLDDAFRQAKMDRNYADRIQKASKEAKDNRRKIVNEVNGIDFNKPVERINIKKGDVFYQYNSGKTGNYVSDIVNQTPSQSGVSAVGKNGLKNKYEIVFKEGDIPALKSTSKEINDTWSIGMYDQYGRFNPIEVKTSGGGSQIYIPGETWKSNIDLRQINLTL